MDIQATPDVTDTNGDMPVTVAATNGSAPVTVAETTSPPPAESAEEPKDGFIAVPPHTHTKENMSDRGKPGWYTVLMITKVAGAANIIAKGVVENENGEINPYTKTVPIIPMPNLSLIRLKLNDKQDATLTGFEILNYGLNNAFTTLEILNPSQIRTDGQIGFASYAINNIFEPSQMAALPRGPIASRQHGAVARFLIGGNAVWGIVLSSNKWQQMHTVFDDSCMPWKDANYTGPGTCEEHMGNTANGVDAVIGANFGDSGDATNMSDDKEGITSAIGTTQESAISQYRTAYGMGYYLVWNSLETTDGKPSWLSLAGVLPYILDITINSEVTVTHGDETEIVKMSSADKIERAVIGGMTFGLSAITDDPIADVANANTLSYLLISPNYPAILEGTTTYNDLLAGEAANTYDNPDSIYNVLPWLSIGGYGIDSGWSGFMSGYALAKTDGIQQYAPLALTTAGLGLQVYHNATNGDPQNWKYIGLGAGLAGASTLIGYASGGGFGGKGNKTVAKLMEFNPQVSVSADGFMAGISLARF